MNLMEKCLATTEQQLRVTSAAAYTHGKGKKIKKKVPAVPQPQSSDEDSSDTEMVVPSKKYIKQDPAIQQQKARLAPEPSTVRFQ